MTMIRTSQTQQEIVANLCTVGSQNQRKVTTKMAELFSKLPSFDIKCPFNWEDSSSTLSDRRLVAAVGTGLCVGGVTVYLLSKYVQSKQKQLEIRNEATCNFPSLWGHTNLMSKHLTPELYVDLSSRRTPTGFTLDCAIQPGNVISLLRHVETTNAHVCFMCVRG